MTSKGHALSREELVRALTSYTGIATSKGETDGTTIVDANLDDRNDFITEKTIIIMSGDAKDEDKGALSFVKTHPATITLQGTGFSAQIKAGTVYRVLNISTVEMDVARIEELVNSRVVGREQIIEVPVTAAANGGDQTLATVTEQPCIIESVVIHANAAQTGDLTTCAVYGGAGKVATFIGTADATQANLDAADKQVAWTGAARLAAGKTLVMTLVGSNGTAVDLTVTITYRACVSGGYLT